MANLSNVTYTANGVTTVFVVPFSYIEEADITVTVDSAVVTNYTFNGSGDIDFGFSPPADTLEVYISRDSDVTQRVTTYADGSALTEEDLNDGGDQSIYLHQETRDLIDTINADNSSVLNRVEQNETDIVANADAILITNGNVDNNSNDIVDLQDRVTTTEADINTNVDGISANSSSIGDNTSDISTNTSDIGTNTAAIIPNTTHRGLTNNPHSVTKTQIGLSDVDNTSDADKPVSTATQTALDLKLDTQSDVAVTLKEITTPTQPSSGYKSIYPKTDGKLYSLNDVGEEVEIGSGGGSGQGGINYITNYSFEDDVANWTGDTNIAIAHETINFLRGTGSMRISKDSAVSGQSVTSDTFTVDPADLAKKLTISFDYDFSDADYDDGMAQVRIIQDPDGTPSTIRVNGEDIKGGKGTHYAQFQTDATQDEYALEIYWDDNTAADVNVYIDNVKVGPTNLAFGTIVTDWEEYTPASTWLSNVTHTAKWRRVGDQMELNVHTLLSGTPTSATYKFDLPVGYSIDTSKLATSYEQGTAWLMDGNVPSSRNKGTVQRSGLTSFQILSIGNSVVTQSSPFVWASGDSISVKLSVPIQGWSSNTQMSEDLGGREVVDKFEVTASTQSIPTATDTVVLFDTIDEGTNTHSLSSGGVTISESGWYNVNAAARFNNLADSNYAQGHIRINSTKIAETITTNGQGSGEVSVAVSVTTYMEKGDVMDFTVNHNYGSNRDIDCAASRTYMSLAKLASPQTILETETVAARYTSDSGQSIPHNSGTVILFEDIDYDTHNAYDASTGEYTVPTSGFYDVSMRIRMEGLVTGSSAFVLGDFLVNATQVSRNYVLNSQNPPDDSLVITISDTLYLNKGDILACDVFQSNNASTKTLSTTGTDNVFTIKRIK